MNTRRTPHLAFLACCFLAACSTPACNCAGFTPEVQGTYQGDKINSAAAARLTSSGFGVLNRNSAQFLQLFAPGGVMNINVPCTPQSVALGPISAAQLAIADTGSAGCTDESCGRMDGTCSGDVGKDITIAFNSLSFSSAAPNLLKATVNATVQTGAIPISSTGNAPLLCFANQRAKFTVDLDTERAQPPTNDLALNLSFNIDTRWDQLLSIQVTSVGNAQACSGSATAPSCIDPNDMEIINEGCSSLAIAQLNAVKAVLINQITGQLQTQITDALKAFTCAQCGVNEACPNYGAVTSTCDVADTYWCFDDTDSAHCVPTMFGMEGRLDVGSFLGALGAPANAAMEVAIEAGGGAEANTNGLTAGIRGGAKAIQVADCVAVLPHVAPPALPLPDFDTGAPAGYDVGVSVSNQMLSEMLFNAEQSGALCLQIGNEQVSFLSSDLLSALLPSLATVTGNKPVPLRIVIRPQTAPKAVVGAGTFDAQGNMLEPLITMSWQGVEIDLYALIEDRYARLFTLAADVALPIGVDTDGCANITPVIGSLSNAITNIQVRDSEILAEDATTLASLVPALLTVAEPQLAGGLGSFTLPEVQGFSVRVLSAHGVGNIAGTQTYNHAAFYAQLADAGVTCTGPMKVATQGLVRGVNRGKASAKLMVPEGRYSWRVDEGFWSTWRMSIDGAVEVDHPRLLLGGAHVIELRNSDGEVQRVELQ